MEKPSTAEWLFYLLGMGRKANPRFRLEGLSGSEWNEIIDSSKHFWLSALLYRELKGSLESGPVPPDVMERLRQLYLKSGGKGTLVYHHLSKLLTLLKEEDIPVIVLKGAHLAEIVYGNVALRNMGDIDLLAQKKDLVRIQEKFIEKGYGTTNRIPLEKQCRERQHLETFYMDQGLAVEVHWTIERPTSPFRIDEDGLWERCKLVGLASCEARVLSPEDLLLHLCLHTAFHHSFAGALRSFFDISKTIRHYLDEINWKEFLSRAEEWRARNLVTLTLHLTRRLLGTSIPDEVFGRMRFDPLMRWLSFRLERQFLRDGTIGKSSKHMLHFKMREGFGDKYHYLRKLMGKKRMSEEG